MRHSRAALVILFCLWWLLAAGCSDGVPYCTLVESRAKEFGRYLVGQGDAAEQTSFYVSCICHSGMGEDRNGYCTLLHHGGDPIEFICTDTGCGLQKKN